MRKFLYGFIITALVLSASPVSAQTKTTLSDNGYGYEFEDDPLSAGGFGPNDSRIRVRRGAQRSTLIRPRTQFIKEIIYSIESL